MNQNFDAKTGSGRRDRAEKDEPGDDSGPITVGPVPLSRAQANGHKPRPSITAWSVIDLLVHRFGWLFLGGVAGAGLFLFLGWNVVKPKFTADSQLERYDTPATSEFMKSSPLSSETFSALLRSPELLRRVGETVQPVVAPEAMAKCIKIDPQPDSDIVKVYIAARAPEYAVNLLNHFNEEAIKFTREWQQERARTVSQDYLLKLLGQMNQDINSLSNQFKGMPMSAQVSDKLGQVGSNLNSLSNNLSASPRPSMLIDLQRERLARETAELQSLLVTYMPEHPLVKAAESRRDELTHQIETALNSTNANSIDARAAAIIRPGDGSSTDNDIIRTKLRSLEDARIQMLNRQREADLYAANPPGMIRVLAPANLKTVHRNLREVKITAVTIFGFLLGVGGSLLLVMLVELTDRRLHTVDDVQRVTKLPVLTTLGNLKRMEEEDRTRWAFRTWTMLQGRLSRSSNHGLVCGITSSANGEGRSTWIQLLAEAASHTGFRVLTIATRPSTHVEQSAAEVKEESPEERAASLFQETQQAQTRTEFPPESDPATEYAPVNGEANDINHHAMQQASANPANVLSRPNTVTEQLTGPNSQPMVHIPLPGWVWNLERRKQWREALVHWRQIENLVIFVELPPASVAEAVLLGSNLPNLVWLTESGVADATETREQLETLRHARCNLVGAVLNRETAVSVKRRFPRWVDSFAATVILALCLQLFGLSVANSAFAASPRFSELPPVSPGLNPRPGYEQPPRVAPQPEPIVPQPVPVAPQPAPVLPEPAPGAPEPGLAAPEPAIGNTNAFFSIVNPAQRAEWQRHLTLGPGDVLNFGLFDHPELARAEVAIRPDGYVGYLEADNILASGLTIDELRDKFDQALGQFRRAPRTIITPVAFRSKKYYMLGKVMTKGVYILDRPITVLEAVARAHGLENGLVDRNIIDIADFQHSFLARGGKRIPLNFEKLFQDGDLTQNIAIEPNDYLYFPAAGIQEVYVVGEVRLPGPVTFNSETTIMAAITARGGYTDRAYKARVVVVRGSINSPETIAVDTHAILDARNPDFQLRPRDIIYVNSRPFIKVEELADLAATAFIQSLITSWVGVDIVKPIQ
jgi:polysaccharide export outer membrane protein